MARDPYEWSKNKISSLLEKIKIIKGDGLTTSPGQIWSIKKLLALDYYIDGSHVLFKKYFDNWYYVDTHCGSGLIGFEERFLESERFPGTPLIAALRANTNPFSEYFFSDEDEKAISALEKRLSTIKLLVGSRSYVPVVRDFKSTVSFVKSKQKPKTAFLIVIDPQGFKELKWNLIEQLLRIPTADIFLTYMTQYIALNRANVNPGNPFERAFDEFYGNENWKKETEGQKLLELYVQQIKEFKRFVYVIPVYRAGEIKLYDVIIATNSKGAGNIIDYARKIMDVTTTELIRDAFGVASGITTDLTRWFES